MTVRGEWSQLANLQIVQWAGAHAEHVLRESEMASLPSVGVLQGGALISHSVEQVRGECGSCQYRLLIYQHGLLNKSARNV